MIKDLHELPIDTPGEIVREAFNETKRDNSDILKVLSFTNTPIDVLIKVGEDHLPWRDTYSIAKALVSHPNFTTEIFERIVAHLKILWWGDDPIECRMAWEALEEAQDKHQSKSD